MLNKLIAVSVIVMALGMSSAARAEEKLMVLWPKQRAAHSETMADHAAAYEARGKAYTDHLYDTGGEEPSEPDADFSMGQDIQPVPINVGQVAEMVKGAEGTTPAPANQTAATPH